MSSLAEKLALLSNPEPEFADPENDQDITAAKVPEFDTEIDDSQYISVGNEKSRLRIKNANIGDDARYKGKKTSRSALSKQRGDEVQAGQDVKEHAEAELGHMFEFDGDDDDEEVDEDDEEEVDDDGDDDDLEEEEEEEEEADIDEEEVEESDAEEEAEASDADVDSKMNKAVEEEGFIFDANDTNFAKYGEMDEEESSEDGNSSDKEDISEVDDNDDAKSEASEADQDAFPLKDSALAEVEKAQSVQGQLRVWDKLLATRIQEQKLIARVNRLPVTDYWNNLCSSDEDVQAQVKETQKSLKLLLTELIELETVLMKADSAGEPAPKRRKLVEFSEALGDGHEAFKAERNEIIQKWTDKTRITAGKNSFSSLETSTVGQIEQILANTGRLVDRTKLKRTSYQILGRGQSLEDAKDLTEKDEDIFDDDDFYHQLLRDLIDKKTNSSSDQSQLTRQWLEVQKLRTKLKKKVDTKASKGRKVRYDIHAKLVNFMAPVYSRTGREETNNELFSSLFGGGNRN